MKFDVRALNIQENVKQLSDKVLIDQTDFLVEHERGITILVLRHLREIETRRLFADLGYSSMFEYCIKRLRYSEAEALPRLRSARLMTELPEIEKQIEEGSLNVTNLSKIQSFVRAEKAAQHGLSKDAKLELIAHCQNKSTRKVAQELIQRSHQPALLAEKFHMTSTLLNSEISNSDETQHYSKFEALLDSTQRELLQEFKNLYAHDLQDGTNISVLTYLLTKAVQHKKKKLGLTAKKDNAPLPLSPTVKKETRVKSSPQRKPLPVATKRFIWKRANGCCEQYDGKSKLRCNSKFALQPDHIVPLALGGSDEVTNLQLLCRVHNSRRSIKTFGIRRPT